MGKGRRLLEILSKRPVRRSWYVFIILFFLLIILLPTVYVLSYMITGWDDISTYVLSDTKSTTVEWTRNEDGDFLRYEVHASTDPGFYPDNRTLRILIDTRGGDFSLEKARSTTTTVTSGLNSQESYFYRVRVVDITGLGTLSNLRRDDDSSSWRSPSPPVVLSPHSEDSNITLSWTSSENSDVSLYEIYMSTKNGFIPSPADLVNTTDGSTNSTIISVSSPAIYYFRVRAVGFENLWSESNQQCYAFDTPAVDCASPVPSSIEYIHSESTLGWIGDSIILSLEVALTATAVNFLVGLPMAWFLVRKDFRWKNQLNTLIDVPLAFPTAATGFSAALFWAVTPGIMDKPFGALSITSSPVVLLILLEIVFSFPYMVRSLASILEELDVEYETVARTCGASKLTAARTITLPMFRAGLVTAVTLCLAKCLSETGGVMAALAAMSSREVNATALIGAWKSASAFNSTLVPGLAFLSFLLILLSLVLICLAKFMIMKAKLPFKKVWPILERKL
ncbi:MAG: ABC transporter permease subunit, partial [Thermoplasmata archaeon]